MGLRYNLASSDTKIDTRLCHFSELTTHLQLNSSDSFFVVHSILAVPKNDSLKALKHINEKMKR